MFVPVKSVHNHDTRDAEFGFHSVKKNLLQVQRIFLILAVRFGISCPKMHKLHPVKKTSKTRAFKFSKRPKMSVSVSNNFNQSYAKVHSWKKQTNYIKLTHKRGR